MKFNETKFKGAYIIELEPKSDDRGNLTRIWCKDEFQKKGIDFDLVQGYTSYSKKKGTMRGIHYQIPPFAESKLGRCSKGEIFELIIDLRKGSETYKEWLGFNFKAEDKKMLFIPANFGHAVLSMQDDTEFTNFSNQPFTPEFERGIRFDDPAFNIKWPIPIEVVSAKDLAWGKFIN